MCTSFVVSRVEQLGLHHIPVDEYLQLDRSADLRDVLELVPDISCNLEFAGEVAELLEVQARMAMLALVSLLDVDPHLLCPFFGAVAPGI